MKFSHFSKEINLIIAALIASVILFSPQVQSNLDNNIKNITSKLRCMTCQNQTVYSSDTDFSINIKKIVEEKLKKNETEKEIIDFLVYRYGEYIVFEPQMNKNNIFLWLFPFVILAICLVFLTINIKRNN
jgi:cytochrome c-type biogenesis protein CcmH